MAPPTFDPAQFRITLDDETPSSLTADQENRFFYGQRNVLLVFGTRLAGLERVRESLEKVVEERRVRLRDAELNSVLQSLREASKNRTRSGVDIVLIDMREAWRPELVNEALKRISEQRSPNRIIRPVFLCGPSQAWEWLNGSRPTRIGNAAELQDIWLGPCAKDFVRTRLRDREAPAYACLENPDRPVDMPWPVVVKAAAGDPLPSSIAKAIDIAFAEKDFVSDVVIPQTESALRTWAEFPDEPVTADLLSDLSGVENSEISPENAVRFLDWAGRLGIVHKADTGYRLDSAYAKGITKRFKQ